MALPMRVVFVRCELGVVQCAGYSVLAKLSHDREIKSQSERDTESCGMCVVSLLILHTLYYGIYIYCALACSLELVRCTLKNIIPTRQQTTQTKCTEC